MPERSEYNLLYKTLQMSSNSERDCKFNCDKEYKDRQETGRRQQMGEAADSKLNDHENAVDNCADKILSKTGEKNIKLNRLETYNYNDNFCNCWTEFFVENKQTAPWEIIKLMGNPPFVIYSHKRPMIKQLRTRAPVLGSFSFLTFVGMSRSSIEGNKTYLQLTTATMECNNGCRHDHKVQELGNAAKEKANDASRAIKNAAEYVGDKAGELKNKTKQKIQEGADAIKSH
ncbi:unnamed protein product [Haemonchus placei]|uniref:Senescence domain-containing protein n=1 Tax=Haemonchus placei TaxID=6290 RepID=A0A0N4VU78_HAEPC|nr:unnamed protein product [Haemonchus placei]